MHVNKKAVFDNTFWQVIIRFLTLGLTLLSIKILTNYLGAEGVGKFNTITTYINFFIVIADLGLFAVTVREISQKPEHEKKILSNVFTIRLWSALAAVAVSSIIVLATKFDNDIKIGTLIACGFLFFNLLASVYDMLMQARLKMQFSALAEFLSRVISIIALIVIVKNHGNFYWVASTIALWGIFIFIFKYSFASLLERFNFSYDAKFARQIIAMSWPLGVVFIVSNLYFKLDTIILFTIKGAAAAGIYTVAFKILEVIAFISSYFSSALKPAISQNIHQNKAVVSSIVRKGITIMLMAALLISSLSIAFRKEIILLLSSPEFSDSARVLVFLAFSLPIIFINNLLVEIFIANDSRARLLKMSAFILLFNFGLNLALIPAFSYFGAAASNLVSALVLLGNYLYNDNLLIGIKIYFHSLAKLLLTASLIVFMAEITLHFPLHFLLQMVFYSILYVILLFLLGVIKKNEISELFVEP